MTIAFLALTSIAGPSRAEEPASALEVERTALEAALATGEPLEVDAERRWRWLLWSVRETAWSGDRLRPVTNASASLEPFAGAPTLATLVPHDIVVATPIVRIEPAGDGYVPFQDDPPRLERDGPSPPPAVDSPDAYTPFESHRVSPARRLWSLLLGPSGATGTQVGPRRHAAPTQVDVAACGDEYEIFGTDADTAPRPASANAASVPTSEGCDDTWTTLELPLDSACGLERWEQPRAAATVPLQGMTLRHPVDGTLRDVALTVADHDHTLAAGVPVVSQPVDLGAAGFGLELTSVTSTLDAFASLLSMERVYVLADMEPRRLRRRAVYVMAHLCGAGSACAASAYPLRSADGVSMALIAVRPPARHAFSLPGWTYQLAARP